jgi:hypothetical protein
LGWNLLFAGLAEPPLAHHQSITTMRHFFPTLAIFFALAALLPLSPDRKLRGFERSMRA